MRLHGRRFLLATSAAAVLGLAGTGIAAAAIPASGGVAAVKETRYLATKVFPTGLATGTSEAETVTCPSGQQATGGGYALGGSEDPMVSEKWLLIASNMGNPPTSWSVTIIMTGTPYTAYNLDYALTAYVLCRPA